MPHYNRLCPTCGKKLPESSYGMHGDGTRDKQCRDCMCKDVDINNPQTFLPILKHFDVVGLPGIGKAQITYCLKPSKRAKTPPPTNGRRISPTKVVGYYLRAMKINKLYKEQRFSNTSDFENDPASNRSPEYKDGLNLTDLHLDDYIEDTTPVATPEQQMAELKQGQLAAQVKSLQEQGTLQEQHEQEILNDLTPADKKYLGDKWGYSYRPSEGLEMEETYRRYASEYDMNVDREETLRAICKTSLKLNQSIDEGDTNSAKAYSSMVDQLRKSAKFTEAQRDTKNDHKQLDTIGELVRLAETDEGIIPQLETDPFDVPSDKLDFAIKDIQNYIYNLVTKEAGLSGLIETYIKKLDQREEIEQMEMDKIEEPASTLGSEEEEDISNEAEQLLEKFGGDDES